MNDTAVRRRASPLAALMALLCVLALAFAPAMAWADDETELTSTGGELSSGSYILNEDVTLTTDITIPSGAEVTIDLNGYTLTGTGSGSVITVNGTLTLTDSGSDGKITGGIGNPGGTDTDTYNYGGGVFVEGEFTMSGGTITNNTATYGGGVYVYSGEEIKYGNAWNDAVSLSLQIDLSLDTETKYAGKFTMSGGTITGNTATIGGGVYNNSGTVTVNGDTLANNTATTAAADAYSTASGTLSISGANSSTTFVADSKGLLIDGWYQDTSSARYYNSDGTYNITRVATNPDTASNSSSEVFWIAAHAQYTVTYDANETSVGQTDGSATGSTTDTGAYTADDTVTVASNGYSLTGYTFTSWNTAADGTGTSYAAGGTFTMTSELAGDDDEVVLYAQWTEDTYTVTYTDGVDGEDVFEDTVYTITYTQKTAGEIPGFDPDSDGEDNTPERDGYIFAGWAVTEDEDGNLTYTATWTEIVEESEESEEESTDEEATEEELVKTGDSTAFTVLCIVATGAVALAVGIAVSRRRRA